jgi:O-antigen/teichoic acid export membrane protein
MEIKVNRKDILWGYLAQFVSLGSGIIVLPVVLKLLSPEEVGFNYILLTIGTCVSLMDLGFSHQLGRNITYIFSGVKELKKKGISECHEKIDYQLLKTTIQSAKYLYRCLSIIVLLVLTTIGTWYIYIVTNSFTKIQDGLLIWSLYCLSICFNIYFLYYASLLNGSGRIRAYRKATIVSKSSYIILSILLLLSGFGLMSLIVANLISPFLYRYICYRYFFTPTLKKDIAEYKIDKKDVFKTLSILWNNSVKLGGVYIGNFTISKASIFIAGLYLSLEDVASYGLMTQIFSFIGSCAMTIHYLYHPRITSLWVKKDKSLINNIAFTLIVFIILYWVTAFVFCFLGNNTLQLLDSNTNLPPLSILLIYSIFVFFEYNQSIFTAFISVDNEIPFLKATLISGIVIVVLSFVFLKYFTWKIMGLVIAYGFVQLAYNDWKWVYYAVNKLGCSYPKLVRTGFYDLIKRLK